VNIILSLPIRIGIITLAITLWLIVFFTVKKHRVAPESRLYLATQLDLKIPFLPRMALVYFSTYIFILLPFLKLSNARLFVGILVSYVVVTLVSTVIHVILPSQVKRIDDLAPYGLSGKLLDIFQQICKPYDNFPSMHVGYSVLVVGVYFLTSGTLLGSIVLVWAILIALSTLFTKQHLILDVLAGTLNGAIVFTLMIYLLGI